jgi:hypothetical protein
MKSLLEGGNHEAILLFFQHCHHLPDVIASKLRMGIIHFAKARKVRWDVKYLSFGQGR